MRSNSEVVLNEEQKACVNAIEGVYVTVASPGSGKTTILIKRFVRMLELGISTKKILNLSFTSAAASEMVSRSGLFGAEDIFRTFHSLAIEILKKEKQHLPFEVCDTIIPVAMEDYKLLFELIRIYPACNWRTLQEKISLWKREDILPDQAIDESRNNGVEYFYALAYRDYEIKCRAASPAWLDFDSLMREVVNLLETNEEVRSRWKKEYISIDECQDTDSVQARFVELLFEKNLFCVGDLNQGVFEWRSAAPDVLTNFVKTLPGVQTLFLGENFRSTKKLVSFFREILPQDNGIASKMVSNKEDGIEPVFTKYQDDEQEAEQILKAVSDPMNTAIIARTNRQLYTVQRICLTRGIKYKILSKRDLFETNEVKKLLSLAKGIEDPRPASVVLSDLIQQHNLLNLYKYSGRSTDSNPIENLNSIVRIAANKGNLQQFLTYFRKLSHARKSAKGVVLSTGHSAKGREFDHVFVIGLRQGVLPHRDGEINEEKRIYFVSCTRAAKSLNVSYYGEPSEFITNYLDRVVEHQSEE